MLNALKWFFRYRCSSCRRDGKFDRKMWSQKCNRSYVAARMGFMSLCMSFHVKMDVPVNVSFCDNGLSNITTAHSVKKENGTSVL